MLFPKDKYSRQLQWRTVLAVWLQIMQELVGIGVVTVYAVDLFSSAGFSDNTSKLLASCNNISYMFSVIFAVITLDRYGRKCKYRLPMPLTSETLFAIISDTLTATMVWGTVGMASALLIAGILDKYAAQNGLHQKAYRAGVATMTFLYTATFGATWLTTPWLYPTEIFPLNVRAKGGAWSVVGWSIDNGIVTMVCVTNLNPKLLSFRKSNVDILLPITPFLFQDIGYCTLLLLFGLNILVIPFVTLIYPETAGRSLEQMDTFFEHGDTWNIFKARRNIRDKDINAVLATVRQPQPEGVLSTAGYRLGYPIRSERELQLA
jgi:hypothetical protein